MKLSVQNLIRKSKARRAGRILNSTLISGVTRQRAFLLTANKVEREHLKAVALPL